MHLSDECSKNDCQTAVESCGVWLWWWRRGGCSCSLWPRLGQPLPGPRDVWTGGNPDGERPKSQTSGTKKTSVRTETQTWQNCRQSNLCQPARLQKMSVLANFSSLKGGKKEKFFVWTLSKTGDPPTTPMVQDAQSRNWFKFQQDLRVIQQHPDPNKNVKARCVRRLPNLSASRLRFIIFGKGSQMWFPISAIIFNITCAFSLEVNSRVLMDSHLWRSQQFWPKCTPWPAEQCDQWMQGNLWKVNFWEIFWSDVFLILEILICRFLTFDWIWFRMLCVEAI